MIGWALTYRRSVYSKLHTGDGVPPSAVIVDMSALMDAAGPSEEDSVFWPLRDSEVLQDNTCTELIFYFHGPVRDGTYPKADRKALDKWIKDSKLAWLYWLEERPEPKSKVYLASYERYAEAYRETGQVDLFYFGDLLFKGAMKVREKHKDAWKGCHVILIGHSVGGLAIKQLVLHAELHSGSSPGELDEEDPSLGFLRKLAGIFYFSTPHSDSADLTRLLGRSKSPVGAALAGLGKVTQRLNSQFSRRRMALRIPAAAVIELWNTTVVMFPTVILVDTIPSFAFKDDVAKVVCSQTVQVNLGYERVFIQGNFTGIVVPEGSARMDVDVAYAYGADHFDICMINDDEYFKTNDTRYCLLKREIENWAEHFQTRAGLRDEQQRNSTLPTST